MSNAVRFPGSLPRAHAPSTPVSLLSDDDVRARVEASELQSARELGPMPMDRAEVARLRRQIAARGRRERSRA